MGLLGKLLPKKKQPTQAELSQNAAEALMKLNEQIAVIEQSSLSREQKDALIGKLRGQMQTFADGTGVK